VCKNRLNSKENFRSSRKRKNLKIVNLWSKVYSTPLVDVHILKLLFQLFLIGWIYSPRPFLFFFALLCHFVASDLVTVSRTFQVALEVMVSLSNFHKRYFVSSFSSAEYTFQGPFFFFFCLCHFVASDRVSSFPSCARSLSFRIHTRYPSHRHGSSRFQRLRAILHSNKVASMAIGCQRSTRNFPLQCSLLPEHANNLLARWT
jgi:hypothetical protein